MTRTDTYTFGNLKGFKNVTWESAHGLLSLLLCMAYLGGIECLYYTVHLYGSCYITHIDFIHHSITQFSTFVSLGHTQPTPFKLSAEVPRLRHRVAVLEGMVETHRKNADEYYSELCTKSKDYDALMAEKNQLKEKAAHLEELRDVQDELDQAKLNLCRAEKNLERVRSENESLRGYKECVRELEVKVEDYDLTHAKLHEYKEVLHPLFNVECTCA